MAMTRLLLGSESRVARTWGGWDVPAGAAPTISDVELSGLD